MRTWALPIVMAIYLSVTVTVCAQPAASFNAIDGTVRSIDDTRPDLLAQKLTAPYHTDTEKVRSIFRWITENIAYATRPQNGRPRSSRRYKPIPMDSLLALKTVDEIVAYTVLQNRIAVCNGYARLFKTLCQYAGIRAELVTGYARGGLGSTAFRPNHTWNAVYVDGAWQLVDATWASGFISFADAFVKQYDDAYFFPDPERFIRSHYPEDLKWALVPSPPTLQEFHRAPFRLTAFSKYGIQEYRPARGVVEAAIGDTLEFRFTRNGDTSRMLAPELYADSMLLSGVPSLEFLKPSVQAGEIVYSYAVQSPNVEWVHLVYNDDVILRYRLNIRKLAP